MKKEINWQDIDAARKLLELPNKASISTIKNAYYRLSKKYHPDNCSDTDRVDMMKRVVEAYKLLIKYCEEYPIPLVKDEITDNEVKFSYQDKFYSDWW